MDTAWRNCALRGTVIGSGKRNDLMVCMAQMLLRIQFPKIGWLQLRLLQMKEDCASLKGRNNVQTFHCRRDHWMTASTFQALNVVMKVYDSVYDAVDKETEKVKTKIHMCIWTSLLTSSTCSAVSETEW